MNDEALLALETISQSPSGELAEFEHWIKAFKAIRWVVATQTGLALTPAGRQARDDMAARLRRAPSQVEQPGRPSAAEEPAE